MNSFQKHVRYLIAADPAEKLDPKSDTTLRMAWELKKLSISVDYLDLSQWDYKQDSKTYLSQMPVREVLSVDPFSENFIELASTRTAKVEDYSAILQRKDPPVDESYIESAKHFAKATDHILQINNPDQTYRYSEKELVLRYPAYAAPTELCNSFEELLNAVRKQPDEAVVKPTHLFSGIGIGFFKRNVSEDILRAHWEKWKPCFVQPYLKAITEVGDLRILVFNKKVIGQVLRVPAKGSRLGNLKQGATPAFFDPTPKQLRAVEDIAEDLTPLGLYLLGLDFIGDYLTEVNITCPTTIPQIEEVMKNDAGRVLVEEIENLRKKLQGESA